MLYELINPSDKYVFEAPDVGLAALAVLVLGEGKYAAKAEDGGPGVPFMLFACDWGWLREHCFGIGTGEELAEVLRAKAPEVAGVLESLTNGGFDEWAALNGTWSGLPPEEALRERTGHNARAHGSLNDIGGKALRLAGTLRRMAAKVTG